MATSKIIELDENNICKICENGLAKYSCPRCTIKYCSLACYQSEKHLECSESFYKDCVLEDLKQGDNTESQKKILEILKRNKLEDIYENEDDEELDSDDEEYKDIMQRLEGVDLDDADKVWEKLTDDERQEFVAFLKSEDVTKLIPNWIPWWEQEESKIEEIGATSKYPEIVEIKTFNKISRKPPSNCVKYNLINVLGAYLFTSRYFNGEHLDFSKEAASCVITISLNLKNDQNFVDFETAIKSVEQECINCEWIMTDKENFANLQKDLNTVLNYKDNLYVIYALCDLHKLFKTSLKNKEKTGSFSKSFPEHFPNFVMESKEKIRKSLRKIDYYLSYSKYCLKYNTTSV